MHLNLGSILRTSAFETPDAVVMRAGDQSISYAELERAARGVATRLRERGIGPGDKVALLVPNVPEFTIAYFGILYAGAAVVPINVLAAPPEVTYFLQDAEARMLIVHPLFEEVGRAGAAPLAVSVVVATSEIAPIPSASSPPPSRSSSPTRPRRRTPPSSSTPRARPASRKAPS
jgi:long-chain acyl-CoA synthetase